MTLLRQIEVSIAQGKSNWGLLAYRSRSYAMSCLNGEILCSLKEVRNIVIVQWRKHYNTSDRTRRWEYHTARGANIRANRIPPRCELRRCSNP